MKKLLLILCIVSLLTAFFPSALAASPVVSVDDGVVTVTYDNPNAKGRYTYVLMDSFGRISLVEIDVGDTWTPDLKQDGLYNVMVYYKDKDGVTHSEESGYQEVRLTSLNDPKVLDGFLDDISDPLPSSFTNPVVYNEPTPLPTQAPVFQNAYQSDALLYTLPPAQGNTYSTPVPTVASTPIPFVSYPGTKPCFEHVNIRIRISDNDSHAATKGRSGPGTDMPQVATLNIGEVYKVLDCRIVENGNVHWFMVNKNGVNCWVASGRCERY